MELTATAPARIYNLHPKKGSVAVGADADLVVWDPQRKVTIADGAMHDRTGYTPYAGRTVTGWPETVIRRGETVIRGGRLSAAAGSGQLPAALGRRRGRPLGRLTADMTPARNFGARLYDAAVFRLRAGRLQLRPRRDG